MLLGDLDDGLRRQQRATGATQGRIGHDVDALLLAEVDELLLGKLRVVLDLVDGRNGGGVGQELLKPGLAVLFYRCVVVSAKGLSVEFGV